MPQAVKSWQILILTRTCDHSATRGTGLRKLKTKIKDHLIAHDTPLMLGLKYSVCAATDSDYQYLSISPLPTESVV